MTEESEPFVLDNGEHKMVPPPPPTTPSSLNVVQCTTLPSRPGGWGRRVAVPRAGRILLPSVATHPPPEPSTINLSLPVLVGGTPPSTLRGGSSDSRVGTDLWVGEPFQL